MNTQHAVLERVTLHLEKIRKRGKGYQWLPSRFNSVLTGEFASLHAPRKLADETKAEAGIRKWCSPRPILAQVDSVIHTSTWWENEKSGTNAKLDRLPG